MNSARLRQTLSSVYERQTLWGSHVFQPFSASRTFWSAVSRENGGTNTVILSPLNFRLSCKFSLLWIDFKAKAALPELHHTVRGEWFSLMHDGSTNESWRSCVSIRITRPHFANAPFSYFWDVEPVSSHSKSALRLRVDKNSMSFKILTFSSSLRRSKLAWKLVDAPLRISHTVEASGFALTAIMVRYLSWSRLALW